MVLVRGVGATPGVIVGRGRAVAVAVGDSIAVGLGGTFAEAQAVRRRTASVATILNFPPPAMNNLHLRRRIGC
jgi:hypothetical protein